MKTLRQKAPGLLTLPQEPWEGGRYLRALLSIVSIMCCPSNKCTFLCINHPLKSETFVWNVCCAIQEDPFGYLHKNTIPFKSRASIFKALFGSGRLKAILVSCKRNTICLSYMYRLSHLSVWFFCIGPLEKQGPFNYKFVIFKRNIPETEM